MANDGGRRLEITGDMAQPREVRIIEGSSEDDGPHSYSVHVVSPEENILRVTHYKHVVNADGEEEAIPYEHHDFDGGNAFIHHVRQITHLPSSKLRR